MTRETIIAELKDDFIIQELVDEVTYTNFGDDSWQFFDTDTLHTLLVLRKGINLPFEINNWYWGGVYDERGLRTNISEIVYGKTIKKKLYLSGHVLGKAFDFKVKGMSSDDVRQWAVDNADLFPCKVRFENINSATGKSISWVHFDTKSIDSNTKIYLFNI